MAAEGIGLSLRDLPAIWRRRRTVMLVIFGVIFPCALVAALLWPSTYRATGTILIEQQELPSELVLSTISSYADQRIQVIKQQVMTTENLYRIIQKYDLYAKDRRSKPQETIVKTMTDSIAFKMISAEVMDPRSGRPTQATIAFSIGFESESPQTAARVANELVSLYLERNIESRKQHTADAADFLGNEAQRLSARIEELQAQIATFKQQHSNELPEESMANQAQLTRAEDEARDVDTRISSLEQQIVYLDAQLVQLRPTSQVYTSTGERILSPADRLKYLRTQYAQLSGVYAPDHPDVLRIKREMEGLEKSSGSVDNDLNELQRQLEDATTQLAAARQKYSADHPDVTRLERLTSSIEDRLAKARAQPAAAKGTAPEPDNPAYIQLKAQREASVNEKLSLARKGTLLRTQIAGIERHLANAPAVERDYSVMARELDSDQIHYREIRQKQMEAQASQNLETERKGERFTLIEPPLTPTAPASPNRKLIVALGLLLALGAAGGAAALLELSDTSVRSRRDLTALLSIPPLAVLPWIVTEDDLAAQARVRAYSVAAVAVALVIAITLVHFLYQPLDVLWQVAMRRLAD